LGHLLLKSNPTQMQI